MEDAATIILLFAGFAGGFIGSEVGAGALITLPVLLFLGLPPATAIATNVLSAWLINAVAAYDYWRTHKVQQRIVWHLAPIALIGAIVGAELIIHLDQRTASAIIAVLFTFVFLVLFALLKHGTAGLQAGSNSFSKARKLLAAAFAFGLGVYGGFFAVGVTTLFVIMIVYVLRRDFVQAAADSVWISSVFLLGSLITFGMNGLIEYRLAIPLALGSVIGAHVGAQAAVKFGNRWLKGLVMVIVILVVAKLAYQFVDGGSALACQAIGFFCD